MTEIMSLPPGPELDALVAHHVMGYSDLSQTATGMYENSATVDWYRSAYPYSTDYQKAIAVLEKLQSLGWTVIVTWPANAAGLVVCDASWWKSKDELDEPICDVEGETFPHAVCRLALLAVEHMKENGSGD